MERRYVATVVGSIWWPMGVDVSYEYVFYAPPDLEPAEERAYAIDWPYTNAGDFSEIYDYQLVRDVIEPCGHRGAEIVKDWESEETFLRYLDTLPSED